MEILEWMEGAITKDQRREGIKLFKASQKVEGK
jgi:hypothetical protein